MYMDMDMMTTTLSRTALSLTEPADQIVRDLSGRRKTVACWLACRELTRSAAPERWVGVLACNSEVEVLDPEGLTAGCHHDLCTAMRDFTCRK